MKTTAPDTDAEFLRKVAADHRLLWDHEDDPTCDWADRLESIAASLDGVRVSVEGAGSGYDEPLTFSVMQAPRCSCKPDPFCEVHSRTAIEPQSVQDFVRAPDEVRERLGQQVVGGAIKQQTVSKSKYKRLKTQGVDVLPPKGDEG